MGKKDDDEPRVVPCPTCAGMGEMPNGDTCGTCNGLGQIAI